jgi:hypothetical protein
MLTLMRMYEVSGGTIFIDGVDISTLGLHQLRKALSIIPQVQYTIAGQHTYSGKQSLCGVVTLATLSILARAYRLSPYRILSCSAAVFATTLILSTSTRMHR